MELKIKDRDYVADGMGGLVRVSGWDELLERVLFKLSVRRGSFSLLPELGSKLHLLRREPYLGGEAVCRRGAGRRGRLDGDGGGTCRKGRCPESARAAALWGGRRRSGRDDRGRVKKWKN